MFPFCQAIKALGVQDNFTEKRSSEGVFLVLLACFSIVERGLRIYSSIYLFILVIGSCLCEAKY